MALDYKTYQYGNRASADTDTVEQAILDGKVKPKAPSASDLRNAAEWLALYGSDDNLDLAQSYANVVAFLELTAQSKEKRKALSKAKAEFAKANGIKVSQVRIKREAK